MLGAYIATHLSIMLENFEVASYLEQNWKRFRSDLLCCFAFILFQHFSQEVDEEEY